MSTEIESLLTSTPDIRNGQPCISGTGISVHRIAILHNLGHSLEDIVRKYEHLRNHPFMEKEGRPPLTIPNPHGADISVDLLSRILRQAGISRRDWLQTR